MRAGNTSGSSSKTAHCAGAAARDDKLDTRAEACAPREAYVRHVACRKLTPNPCSHGKRKSVITFSAHHM